MSSPFTRANSHAAIFRFKNFWVLNVVCAFCSAPVTAHAGGISIKSLSEFVTYGVAGGIAASRILLGDELSLETNASQNTDVSDNISLNDNPLRGLALRTATDFTGSVITRHRTHNLEFHANTDRVKVLGPGDPGNLESDFGDNSFYSARYSNQWKRFSFDLNASQSIQNAADAQSNDFTIPTLDNGDSGDTGVFDTGGLASQGLTGVNATQESFTVDGSVTANLNQKNSLTFSANASQQSFAGTNPGALVDSKSITTSGSWTSQRSERTSLTASINNLLFTPGDGGGRSKKLETTGSINTQISKRLNMTALAGAAFVSGAAVSTISGGTGTTGASTNGSGTTVGFIGNISFGYDLKKTSFTFDASRSISATSTGGLNASDSAGVQVSHSITRNLAINASADYSVVNATSSATGGVAGISTPGSTQLSITVSPTYSVELNRKWSADMSYEFRYRNRNAGSTIARSNGVFVSVRRSLPVGR